VVAALFHRHKSGKPPLSQRQIAQRAGLDINVVSQVVRDLERRAILRRDQHPDDSRAHQVTLSESGLVLAKLSTATARRLNDEFFAHIDGAVLAPVLEKLTNAV